MRNSHGEDPLNLCNDPIEFYLGRRSLLQSAAIMILRLWMETVEEFLKYLQFGKDSPFEEVCGGISNFTHRNKIQAGPADSNIKDGKLPHGHTSILQFKSHPRTEQEEALPLLNMIRGSIETFATKEEQRELVKNGFVSNGDMMISFLEEMRQITKHHCMQGRCMIPVRSSEDDGSSEPRLKKKCKQRDNRKMNPHPFSHYFKPIDVQHSMEALTILSNIGMIVVLSDNADSRQIYSWEPLPDIHNSWKQRGTCPRVMLLMHHILRRMRHSSSCSFVL
jgi:hypothetical protein